MMDIIQQYEKLLDMTAQIGGMLQGNMDSLAQDDILTIIEQRQDLMAQISDRREIAGTSEEAAVEEIIRQIQNLDQINYTMMEKFKQECSVKLNEMKQSHDAFDAYNPVSNEASAYFIDKKR